MWGAEGTTTLIKTFCLIVALTVGKNSYRIQLSHPRSHSPLGRDYGATDGESLIEILFESVQELEVSFDFRLMSTSINSVSTGYVLTHQRTFLDEFNAGNRCVSRNYVDRLYSSNRVNKHLFAFWKNERRVEK